MMTWNNHLELTAKEMCSDGLTFDDYLATMEEVAIQFGEDTDVDAMTKAWEVAEKIYA